MKKILSSLVVFMMLLIGSFSLVSGDSTNIKDFDFMINVEDITPGSTALIGDSSGETINNVLLTVLEKLIVVFGVCSVFIMTVGAGYMIIYHGQDEFLSKGKSIFMSGIIALAVALSAGVIVKLFAFLLY